MAVVAHLPAYSPFSSNKPSYLASADAHAMANWNRTPPYSSDVSWSHHQTPSWSTYAARTASTYHSNDIPDHSFAASTPSSASLAEYDTSPLRTLGSSPDLVGPLEVKYSPTAGDGTLLYPVIDDDFHASDMTRRSASPTVKIEHDDHSTSSIVFETSLTLPPLASAFTQAEAQVPLRATQASKEMRRLMGVFRLDPFAVQGPATPPTEVGPLEEPGRLIEFQLPLEDEDLPSPTPEHSPASSVPPDSEWGMLHSKPSVRSLRSLPSDASLEDSPHYGIPLPTLFPNEYAPTPSFVFDTNSTHGVPNSDVDSRASRGSHRHASLDQRGFPSSSTYAGRSRHGHSGWAAERGWEGIRHRGSPSASSRPTMSGASYSDAFDDTQQFFRAAVTSEHRGDGRHGARGWDSYGQGSYR